MAASATLTALLGSTRDAGGKKPTFLDSPRLHQNWLLRLLCPKNLDTRVWTFWERPCVKAPLAGYTAFLTGGFHRAITCSVTVNEDGFPNYTNSYSLKIYHYPWLRLIS